MNIINMLTSRKYYKSAFLFVVFLNTLGIGYFDMDITFLYTMLILWGVCIIGVETLKGKLWYHGNHLLYIGGFFICLSLATFANHPYSSQTSFLMLTLQLLVFLLLFTQKKGTSLMTVKNDDVLFNVYSIADFCFDVFSECIHNAQRRYAWISRRSLVWGLL